MTRDYVTITFAIYRDDKGEPTCEGCEFNANKECGCTDGHMDIRDRLSAMDR
jgi:hypothetical protein